jgi:dTDP-4-amino-4,6-dideoxygalactose transaminase
LYPIQIDVDKSGRSRKQIFNKFVENGVNVNVHYIPIHMQPYYQQFGFKEGDFPNSEAYYACTISIPLFYGMTDSQQDRVVSILKKALQ